jgi:hypothetical protein
MAPGALDGNEAHARIADLKSLLSLPGQTGMEVRWLYALVYGSLAEASTIARLQISTKPPTWPLNSPLPNGNWRCGMKLWGKSIKRGRILLSTYN